MNLIHYSEFPLQGIHAVSQLANKSRGFMKPAGLWVSVEGPGDWLDWCQANGFAENKFAVHTKINLVPRPNILHIATAPELMKFHRNYYRLYYETLPYPDWQAVANEYDGIIIAPYQHSCRLLSDTIWYYCWDCASGCIWSPDCIESWEVLETNRKEKRVEKES